MSIFLEHMFIFYNKLNIFVYLLNLGHCYFWTAKFKFGVPNYSISKNDVFLVLLYDF